MIYSMTGYGEAEGQIGGLDYRLEIKTVNNRYLRTEIRLPDALTFIEDEIEQPAAKALSPRHGQLHPAGQGRGLKGSRSTRRP